MRSISSTWRFIRYLFLALTLVVTMVSLSGVGATGVIQAAPDTDAALAAAAADGLVSSDSQGVQVAATRPWTADEMRAAQPHPGSAVADPGQASNDLPTVTGTPGKIDGGLPSGAVGTAGTGDVSVSTAVGTAGYSYPAPFTGFEVFTPYTQQPYITTGKLFFTQGGRNWVCSAASIGNYGIFTAGHCVHAGRGGGWSTNVVFVPAYRDGAAPRGQWFATKLSAYTNWTTQSDLRWDMGGGVLRTAAAGTPCAGLRISACVGWLGFAWNQGYQQHWNSLGYPQQAPFNGQRLRTCQGSHAYALGNGATGPLTHAIGCNMGGGSSGVHGSSRLAAAITSMASTVSPV